MIEELSTDIKSVLYKLMIALSTNPDELQLEEVELNPTFTVRSSQFSVATPA